MNAAIECPASLFGAVSPAPPGLFYCSECSRVERCGAAFGLGGHQPHFFPFPRTFVFARGRLDSADHRAVGLGDYVWLALGGKAGKSLRIVFGAPGLSSLGMFKGAVGNSAGPNFDAVVFAHALGGARKGVFAAEVSENTLQALGTATGAYPDALSQGAQVRPGLGAPDLFAQRDWPKNAAPGQRFFCGCAPWHPGS